MSGEACVQTRISESEEEDDKRLDSIAMAPHLR